MIKNWMLQIEGIDKTGKDLLCNYLTVLSNYKYTPYSRGIVSLLSYNEIYKRKRVYDTSLLVNDSWIFIYLYGQEEDIKTRCQMTKEEYRGQDIPVFEKYLKMIEDRGCIVLRYDVSNITYYNIAKDILQKLEKLEKLEGE